MHYSLTRATVWNILGYAYLLVASFFSTRLLIEGLGVLDFASYILLVATVNLLASLDLGLSQALIRQLSQLHNKRSKQQTAWSTGLSLFGALSLGIGLVSFLITLLAFDHSLLVATLVAIWSALTSLLGLYSTFPQAEGKFGWYNLRTFVLGTANTLIVGFAAIFGYGIVGLVGIQIIFTTITILIFGYLVRRTIGKARIQLDSALARELISYGLKNQLGKLVGQGQAQYGKYALALLSPIAVSAYSIARGLVQNLAGAVTQLSTALFPAVSSSKQDGGKTLKLFTSIEIYLALLSGIGIATYYYFGAAFIYWWLENAVIAREVVTLLNYYVWYLALLVLTPVASTIMDAMGYPGKTSLIGIVAFAIELIISLVLLPTLGIIALPIGALTSLVLLVPYTLLFTKRILSNSTN